MKTSVSPRSSSMGTFRAFPPRETSPAAKSEENPGGGALGYFLGGYVPPGTPNWHSVLKEKFP